MYVIIDCNYICHVAKYSLGDLTWEDKKIGVIFGFLRQILSLAKIFDTNNFIFAWDSKESKRKEILPSYKANRHFNKTEEEKELDAIAYAQFDIIRTEVLPDIGFKNNLHVKGFEADDIIASITKKFLADELIIISSDSDLLQLLDRNRVKMYNVQTKRTYSESNMITEYGIGHELWAKVKAIAGCTSDNIAGVKGVGEKTAIKYLKGELSKTTKAFKDISDFSEDYQKNLQLVTLPFKGMPVPKVIPQRETSYHGMYSICEKYGFQSLLQKETIKQWVKNLQAK